MVVAATAAIALIGHPAALPASGPPLPTAPPACSTPRSPSCPRRPTATACRSPRVTRRASPPTTPSPAATAWSTRTPTSCGRCWSASPGCSGNSAPPSTTPGNGPQTVVDTYGRQLLWSQAFAANETPTTALSQAKQSTYAGIAASLQQNEPAIYPLFQGNQWTTRLEIAFGAMFAALVAGLLILLIALTLIVLKLGFLLLLVAGPFFLIIGTHPGLAGHRHPLVRDAGRRADETGGGRDRAERAAVLLLAHHGHHRPGPAVGAQDLDDRAGHGDRLHLPQAVHPPVLRGRLRDARLRRTGGGQPARRGLHLPQEHGDGRERGPPRRCERPGRPVGAPQPGPGRVGSGRRGQRGRGGRRGGGGHVGRSRDRDGRGGRRVRVAVAPRRAPRGRRGRRDERGYAAAAPAPPAWPGTGTCPRPRAARAPPRPSTCRRDPATATATATAIGNRRRRPARPAPPPAGRAAPGARNGPAHRRPAPARRPAARPAEPAAPENQRDQRHQRNGGPGSRQPAPAWPNRASSGWTGASTGAGPRQRPPAERRPAAPPPQQGNGAAPARGNGSDEQRAMPFWLRPIRRDK